MTYGGNGQVLSNWAQFLLVMHYLSVMEDDQTLVLYSGHPLGIFPAHSRAPRCVISNGMVSVFGDGYDYCCEWRHHNFKILELLHVLY